LRAGGTGCCLFQPPAQLQLEAVGQGAWLELSQGLTELHELAMDGLTGGATAQVLPQRPGQRFLRPWRLVKPTLCLFTPHPKTLCWHYDWK
jgi:hypothetical protein